MRTREAIYHHTQVGRLMPALTVGAVAIVVVSVAVAARSVFVLLPLLLVALIAMVFSTMTIEVINGELRHHFSFGFWLKRVQLDEIESAAAATSSWIEGWGIRATFRGMLYNVSGTRAVEVRLRSGRQFRLGTDEPEVLLAALRQAGVPTA